MILLDYMIALWAFQGWVFFASAPCYFQRVLPGLTALSQIDCPGNLADIGRKVEPVGQFSEATRAAYLGRLI